ncbi:hypothetical protein DSL72_004781 [Monilinia vaccinii-corymbosi]|uniref:Histidine kinase n=1 Tax=Monilinia vaccinii-corymbosi TaxID=61207 RepID=A0A8A3P929_9HELO|nr:hypothetical protein DSL72_004781 [Monilinia vaccinii-corymbosi]
MFPRSRKAPKLMLPVPPTHTPSPVRGAEYFESRCNEVGSVDSGSDTPGESEELDTIGLTDFLDFDPKPTLIFDLLRHNAFEDNLEAVYANKACQSNIHFTSAISRNSEPTSLIFHPEDPTCMTFKSHIKGFIQKQAASGSFPCQPFSCNGFVWSGFMIRKSKQGNSSTTFSDKTVAALKDDQVSNLTSGAKIEKSIMSEIATTTCPDVTVESPVGYLSDHIKFTRNFDWSSTSLGPMSSWSPEFRQLVNLVMANPHPAALYWGEELTLLYNESYSETVAVQKHPQLMGTSARGAFSEIWEEVEEAMNACLRTGQGQGVAMTDQMLAIERRGFVEETFYSWDVTPIWKSGYTPELLGFYSSPFETTGKVVNHRRMRTLLRVSEQISPAQSVPDFWKLVLGALVENEYDFPFVLLYSVLDDVENDAASPIGSVSSDSSTSIKSVILEGSLGVPEGHVSAQTRLDLKRHLGGYVPALREAMKTRQPSFFSLSDSILPVGLTRGYNWKRGYGEPCRDAVVLPLRPTNGQNTLGFLVIGVNPRRPYDADYESFVKLLNRQLANSLASVTLFQDEVRRANNAAEIAAAERLGLYEELALQKSRLQRIAEVSPVGMFSVDSDGVLIEANDRYYEITNLSRDAASKISWMDMIAPSSIPTMVEGWEQLTIHNQPWSGELQLIKPWHDIVTGDEYENWVLASYQRELSSDGSIKSIMGYYTDITLQKRFAKEMKDRAECVLFLCFDFPYIWLFELYNHNRTNMDLFADLVLCSRLSEQLLLRTNQADEIRQNFKRFSDLAPGGLAILDPDGVLTYANEQWVSISGLPKGETLSETPFSWTAAIIDLDMPKFTSKWAELVTQNTTVVIETRMENPWVGDVAGSTVTIQRWVLATFSPELDKNGNLKSVMGCSTDISRIKWAEDLQDRRLKEYNSFIDITSHELRNPLNTLLQCADSISSSLRQYKAVKQDLDAEIAGIIKDGIEAAETIQLCAQHQKSIVDDILTISKLDSNLLEITPVAMRPVEVVELGLKMFAGECQMNSISQNLYVSQSFSDLNIDSVMLDSSRLTQILINLITNAIKFTKNEKRREIHVSVGASLEVPSLLEGIDHFEYFPSPTKLAKADVTTSDAWGEGQIIYLRFEVKDTGCGLTAAEKKNLFTRFSQASPRTHVHYGGSGLGLFISRQLTELQGGEIGVASNFGCGSTFAFYIQCRRASEIANNNTESQVDSDMEAGLEAYGELATNVPNSIKDHEENTLNKLWDLHEKGTLATNRTNSFAFEQEENQQPQTNPSSWSVLIVEDNLVNQKVLAAQMKRLGCTIHVSNHGKEALEFVRKTRFWVGEGVDGTEDSPPQSRPQTPRSKVQPPIPLTLILLDVEMPVMDGLTCARELREMEKKGHLKGHVPVIAVTANARAEQIQNALEAGMDEVMTKPFRITELVPFIEGVLYRVGGGVGREREANEMGARGRGRKWEAKGSRGVRS